MVSDPEGRTPTEKGPAMILTEEQLAVQESARKFAQDRLAPNSAKWEQEARFPRDIFREMGDLGLMGVTIPVEWGGAGADNVAYSLALMEVAAGDGALATVMSGHNSVGVMPVLVYGTEAQKQRYVRDLATRQEAHRLRADRAAGRIGRGLHPHARGPQGRRLRAQRHQAVHHQRRHGRRRPRHRRHRSGRRQARHLRLPRRYQGARLGGGAHREEDGAERLRHLRDPARESWSCPPRTGSARRARATASRSPTWRAAASASARSASAWRGAALRDRRALRA